MRRGVVSSVVLGALLLVGPGAGAQKGVTNGPLQARGADAQFVEGELIVQFRTGVSTAARRDALGSAQVVEMLDSTGLALVRLAEGASVRASAAALARDPDVVFAEPNYIRRYTQVPPDDPRYGELWGLNQLSDADIDAPEAWATTTGSSTVVVGVIDSGVAYGHPDLAGNIWVNPDEPRRRHRQRRQRPHRRRPWLGLRPGGRGPARLQRPRHARRGHDRRGGQQHHRRHRRQPGRRHHGRCARAGPMASKTPTSSRPSTTPATTPWTS